MLDKAVLAVAMDKDQKDARSILERAAEKLSGKTAGEKGSRERVYDAGRTQGLKLFEVQYNPASLKLHGYGGAVRSGGKNTENENQRNEQYTSSSSLSLSLELECDGPDTKQKVNGLLGLKWAARNPYILFCWGKNIFAGIVSEADGEYTMFDQDGRPVRGKVRLTINRLKKS